MELSRCPTTKEPVRQLGLPHELAVAAERAFVNFIQYQRRSGLRPLGVTILGAHHPQFFAKFAREDSPVAWATNQFYPSQNDFSASKINVCEKQLL
jgi:hypothetical protein